MEVYIDDEAKLTLHGLRQHYVKLKDSEKNRKLFELLYVLGLNQMSLYRKVRVYIWLDDELQWLIKMLRWKSNSIIFEVHCFAMLSPSPLQVVIFIMSCSLAPHRVDFPRHRHPHGHEQEGEAAQVDFVNFLRILRFCFSVMFIPIKHLIKLKKIQYY